MKDQEMGSDQFLPISTPKLPIYSLPVKNNDPPGMVTPPLHAAVSVPFEWEEAPGKPRAWSRGEKARSSRCLELPPRMSATVKIRDVCSATTVLGGPYVLGRSGSFRNEGGKSDGVKERAKFGSSRWGSFKENREVGGVRGGDEEDPGRSAAGGVGGEKETKVKITRMTSKSSFLAMSSSRSRLWSSVCESFKQVVPWRQKPEKMRKMKSIPSAIL